VGDFVTEVIEIGLVDRLSRYVTIQVRDDAAARRARPQAVAKPPADAAASQKASDVVDAARPTHVLRHRALRVHCKRCQHAPDPGASWGRNSRKLRAGAKLNRKITRTRTTGHASRLSSFLTEIRPVGTV
jgi:hypothetical protein